MTDEQKPSGLPEIEEWKRVNERIDMVTLSADSPGAIDLVESRKLVNEKLADHNRAEAGITCEGGVYNEDGKFKRQIKVYQGM